MDVKCYNCNKKIKLIKFECVCGHTFCKKCRLPNINHICKYDFHEAQKEKLINELPKIDAKKIIVI